MRRQSVSYTSSVDKQMPNCMPWIRPLELWGRKFNAKAPISHGEPTLTKHSVSMYDGSSKDTAEEASEDMTESFRSESTESDAGSSTTSCLKVTSQELSLQLAYPAVAFTIISERKSVSFGHVIVSSHERMLGDNPSVSEGSPLTIGWKPFDSVTLSINDYESSTSTASRYKGHTVPRHVRQRWLLAAGHSRTEILAAEKSAKHVQTLRISNAKLAISDRIPLIRSKRFARQRNKKLLCFDDAPVRWF